MLKNFFIIILILLILFITFNLFITDRLDKDLLGNIDSTIRIFTLLISTLNISFLLLFFSNNRKYDINKRKSEIYIDWISKNITNQKEELDKKFENISISIRLFHSNMNDKNYRKTTTQIKKEITNIENILRSPLKVVSIELFEKINFLLEQFEDDLNFLLEDLLSSNEETTQKINQELFETQIQLYKLIFEYQIDLTS